MQVIHARVNERLLSKAERLFTGTLDGRIIEILQNARRAGATEVHITNSDGRVTVRDNGQGIADFGALLDLGKSGWDDQMENAEDPAGVGVFCLAPREVTITSGHKQAVIQDKGWTGAPVLVLAAALERLKAAIEEEAYRYVQKRGSHKLKFSEYCRAKELGIELSEAEPVFHVGLLSGEPVEPVEVIKPEDFPLEQCYRLSKACLDADECNEANTHLLSALGTFDSPFVVVDISGDYDGYSWAKLPTIDRVELKVGTELNREYLWCEALVAVESLEITARTSDGRRFSSSVPMAVRFDERKVGSSRWVGTDVLVTLAAREELETTDIWYHLGGWSEDGDTYDTQLADIEEQLNLFWAEVIGPGEYLRQRLFDCLCDFRIDWQSVSIEASGKVWISHKDGKAEMLLPPELSADT